MIDAIRMSFARIVRAETATELLAMTEQAWAGGGEGSRGLRKQLLADARRFGRSVHELGAVDGPETSVQHFVSNLDDGLSLAVQLSSDADADGLPMPSRDLWLTLLGWLSLRSLGGPSGTPDRNLRCRQRMRDWRLDEIVVTAFRDLGRNSAAATRVAEAVAAILLMPMWSPHRPTADASAVLASWLATDDARRALRISQPRSGDERYDIEAFEELVVWTTWVAAIRLAEYPQAYQSANEPMLHWVAGLSGELRRWSSMAAGRVGWLRPRTAGPDQDVGSA
jgi:hypothetical protein